MDNRREVRHAYSSCGITFDAKQNLAKIKGLSNKLDLIFKNLPQCICETIGDKYDLQKQINEIIKTEIERASKTQIVDIPIVWLKKDDLLFDYDKKTIERVAYTHFYNASVLDEGQKPDTVMVAYTGDENCDNFSIKSKVSILINPTASQLINFDYMG